MNFTLILIFFASYNDTFYVSGEQKPPPCVLLQPVCCLTDLPCRPSSQDIASQKFSMPSPVRTVLAADFDNDNELEVFFNNIAYRGPSANRLFRCSLPHKRAQCTVCVSFDERLTNNSCVSI